MAVGTVRRAVLLSAICIVGEVPEVLVGERSPRHVPAVPEGL